jgi:hypothetical protein
MNKKLLSIDKDYKPEEKAEIFKLPLKRRFRFSWLLFLLFCAILAICMQPSMQRGIYLSSTQLKELKQKVASGDADAAWRVWMYYATGHHGETEPWLLRAVELKHPGAQRMIASHIKSGRRSPIGFGTNAPTAVLSLLEQASQTNGGACYELASAYAEGYFGSNDQQKARSWFQRGAKLNESMCWKKLSQYCRNGIGGPKNDSEAYYWISLYARFTDPRSGGGKEAWAAREEIATEMPLPTLEHEWEKIDASIGKITPYLESSNPIMAEREKEGQRLSEQHEKEYRKKMRELKPGKIIQ